MPTIKQFPSILVSLCLILAPFPLGGCGKSQQQTAQVQSSQTQQAQRAPAATAATPTADELYQLVAPIALFPDNLVAQVLAASTYPDQITAANTWMRQNSSVKGDQLMQAADNQPWDVSVKALTQFPDVLNQMATNLSWTSALGDAYFNVPQSVMNAVQVMRQRAQDSGNLKSNAQQNVTVEKQAPAAVPAAASSGAPQTVVVQAPPQTIVIQPAQPQVVYVPTYNPTVVYGAPVPAYPGYSTGDMVAASVISFGVGIAVGAAIANNNSCCGWGWNSWGCGWHSSTVFYNRNVYVSNSNTFVNRNNYYHRNNVNVNNVNRNVNNNNYRANNFNSSTRNSNFTTPTFNQKYNQPQFNNANYNRGNVGQNDRTGSAQANLNQQNRAGLNQNQNRANTSQQRQPARGYEQQSNRGTSSGAFSNYSQGGNARTNSARGEQSLQGNRAGASQAQPRTAGGRRR